ncbi:MAG: ABC transporter permease, partial [Gammaproteobacteria bacterium]|nr:ABC transporter permease [Gammaproteobacteria bacterium]
MTFWIPAALLALAAIRFALAPFLRGSSRRSSGEAIGPGDEAGEAGGAPGPPPVRRAPPGRGPALPAPYRP